MNIRRQKAALLFGAASLGVAINVSTSLVSANNESKDIKKPSKALNILLNFKNSIFNKLKNSIFSVVSYLTSKLSNLNNEELYDIWDGYVANLWNEYKNTLEEYNDGFKGVVKPSEVPRIREKLKEKCDYVDALYKKLSEILMPYAKILVNLENLELRMNKKNDKILITMTDNTTNVNKGISLDFLCEVLHEMLPSFRDIDDTDYKIIIHNCELLRLLTKRKQQFSLLTGQQLQRTNLYSQIPEIINSIRSNNKNDKSVVNYLEGCFKSLKTKDNYIEEVFGKNFKPEKATKLEEFKKLRSYILKKIESQEIEDAEKIVEDFNLSAKELFPEDYKDLLISFQK